MNTQHYVVRNGEAPQSTHDTVLDLYDVLSAADTLVYAATEALKDAVGQKELHAELTKVVDLGAQAHSIVATLIRHTPPA